MRAERTKRAKKLACVVPAAPVPSGAFLLTTGALVVVVGSGDGSVAGCVVVVVATVVVVVAGAGGAPSLQRSVKYIFCGCRQSTCVIYGQTHTIARDNQIVLCCVDRNQHPAILQESTSN